MKLVYYYFYFLIGIFFVPLAACERYDTATKCPDNKYPCLIFEDEFDYFDLETWEHEITAGGGGVSA